MTLTAIPHKKPRISGKLRHAIDVRVRKGCTITEACEEAGISPAGWHKAMKRLMDLKVPTLAAINGAVMGGGLEIALACDLAVAAHDCRFGAPEVLYGSGVVTLLLPYFCGPKRAKEILLTGADRISTEQALDWGLVNRAVQEKNLVKRARELALDIARNDRLAVQIAKQSINASMEIGSMRDALKHALDLGMVLETTATPASREFDEILRTEGVHAALEWREDKLGHHGRVMRHEIG